MEDMLVDTDSIGMDDISGDPVDAGVCEDPDYQDPSEHMSEGEQEEEDAALARALALGLRGRKRGHP